MNIKEYLNSIRRIDEQINTELEQIEQLRSILMRVNAPLVQDKVQTSYQTDKMADTVAKIVDLEKDINKKIDRMLKLKKEVMAIIDNIENAEERLVLKKRYLLNKSWKEIIVDMDLNIRSSQIYIIHRQALKSFRKVYNYKISVVKCSKNRNV